MSWLNKKEEDVIILNYTNFFSDSNNCVSNISIKNIHGYGLLDLQEILEQCDYTVSEVSKRFNIEDNLVLVDALLGSKEYLPLFDRSVDLYTKGLVSMTNRYIFNNFDYLSGLSSVKRSMRIVSAEVANECLKIIITAIWYRGVSQEECLRVIDINKTAELVNTFKSMSQNPYPLISDFLLVQILKEGLRLDNVKCNVPEDVNKCLEDYYTHSAQYI